MIRPVEHPFVHYFDHNATTPLSPAAREAFVQAMDEAWHNPSSPYRDAARVHRQLKDARERVAALVGRATEEIVFTSGATEANNSVIQWAVGAASSDSRYIVSPTEHPSVIENVDQMPADLVRSLQVDRDGQADVGQCEELLSGGKTALVACMAANNETGVLGPVTEIGQLCAQTDVPFLCDASQWIGRLPAGKLPGRAFVVACAHKFGGPKGVGFLCVPATGHGYSGARGGEQEHGRRAGTENFPAIAAMVAALESAERQSVQDRLERAEWREAFTSNAAANIPGACINGVGRDRLWNTVSLMLPRFENTRWVSRLDKLGFQVSTGSACATGSKASSHVLAAIGLSPDETRRTIRVSAGWETQKQDWRALGQVMEEVWRDLSSESSAGAGGVISV